MQKREALEVFVAAPQQSLVCCCRNAPGSPWTRARPQRHPPSRQCQRHQPWAARRRRWLTRTLAPCDYLQGYLSVQGCLLPYPAWVCLHQQTLRCPSQPSTHRASRRPCPHPLPKPRPLCPTRWRSRRALCSTSWVRTPASAYHPTRARPSPLDPRRWRGWLPAWGQCALLSQFLGTCTPWPACIRPRGSG